MCYYSSLPYSDQLVGCAVVTMCASVNRIDPIVDLNERIWSAVWKNDLETLRHLLNRSSKEAINYKHDSGKTALHTAALNIHLDCARLLIGKLMSNL